MGLLDSLTLPSLGALGGVNDPRASSPDDVKRKRALADALVKQGADYSPIRSPWQGVARLAQGLVGGYQAGQADQEERVGRESAAKDFASVLGGVFGGGAPAASPSSPMGASNQGSPSVSPQDSASLPTGDVADYITQAAKSRGIDPNIALRVAQSEGLNSYTGDENSSFGPFQLHYGNVASGGNAVSGLGDEFTKATGLDARDPSTVKSQIDFALDHASKNGWGPWHGWKGDQMAGIGGQPVQVASNDPSQALAFAGAAPAAGGAPAPTGAMPSAPTPNAQGAAAAPQDGSDETPHPAALAASSPAGAQVAQAAATTPQARAAGAPKYDPQKLLAVIQNPWATPAQQQIAATLFQSMQKQETYSASYKDQFGNVVQRDATGKIAVINNAKDDKDKEIKPSIIGEDQFGNKQYGYVKSDGTVVPLKIPQQPGSQAPAAIDPSVTGPASLEGVDPGMASQVKAIVEGRAPYPSGLMLMKPYGQKLAQLVTQYDPSFEAGNPTARAKTLAEFKAGGPNSPASAITAGNTAIQHLGEMSDAGEQLGNFESVPLVNNLLNTAKNAAATGSGGGLPVVKFNNTLNKFIEEATKFYRGTGGNEADLQREIQSLNPNQSPQQLREAIRTQSHLLQSKIQALQDRWRNGMGPTVPDFPIVSEKSQGVLDRVNQRAMPAKVEAAPQNGQPSRLGSKEEYDALPSGSTFVAPDGTTRRKP